MTHCGRQIIKSKEARITDNEPSWQNREYRYGPGYFWLRLVALTNAKATARHPADSSDPNTID
jgi:hypothetical protein